LIGSSPRPCPSRRAHSQARRSGSFLISCCGHTLGGERPCHRCFRAKRGGHGRRCFWIRNFDRSDGDVGNATPLSVGAFLGSPVFRCSKTKIF